MRKSNFLPWEALHAALLASLRRAGELLYVGWALAALAFCGVVAAALL